MVTSEKIEQFLDPSLDITEEEKVFLIGLRNEYPWSEDIGMAYIKALKDTGDSRYHSELNSIALICSDRTRLYKLLHKKQLEKTIQRVEEQMAELPDLPGLIPSDWKEQVHLYSEAQQEEETAVEMKEADVPAIHISTEASEISELPKHHADEISEEVEEFTVENTEEETPLEQSDSKLETAEELLEQKEAVENEVEEEKEESKTDELNELIISEAVGVSITKEVIDDLSEKQEAQETSAEETKTEEKPEHISGDDFIQWLMGKAQEVSYPSFEGGEDATSKSADDIISKFLKNEPQISRGKAKDYSLENLAADSLVDDEEFVTETLAEMYAAQGNKQKAKRAFQLLSLKYPEKSIYFAARIKRLGRKK